MARHSGVYHPTWSCGKFPFECPKMANILTFFQKKKVARNCHFFPKNCQWQFFFRKKSKVLATSLKKWHFLAISLKKVNIFANFFEKSDNFLQFLWKRDNFWQFFWKNDKFLSIIDSQMAIFRRVRLVGPVRVMVACWLLKPCSLKSLLLFSTLRMSTSVGLLH